MKNTKPLCAMTYGCLCCCAQVAIVGKGLTFDSGGYNLKVSRLQLSCSKCCIHNLQSFCQSSTLATLLLFALACKEVVSCGSCSAAVWYLSPIDSHLNCSPDRLVVTCQVGPGSMIELMKFDCGGSAATLGAARILADTQPQGVEVSMSCTKYPSCSLMMWFIIVVHTLRRMFRAS